MNKKQVSLIITDATILTMDENNTVLENAALAIAEDMIVALDATEKIINEYSAAQVLNATDCILIPGLINAHSHIPMAYFKGLADDLPLDVWLQEYIWPLENKLLTPEFVYDASLHGAAEMIKNGITLTNDMYFHGEETAKALTKTGMRGMLGEAMVDFKLSPEGGTESIGNHAVNMQKAFADNPLIDFTIAPHSIYACSAKTLRRCAEKALENDLTLHIHLSESEKEVVDCLRQNGMRPVHYLQQLGLLDTRLVIAHGIWIEESEMRTLAKHDNSVILCIESNLKLSNGFTPIKKYLEHGVRLCFGTDSVASNNNLNLLEEMDFTAKLHKVINNDPTFLPAEQVLRMATIEAAKALGKKDELGSLEIGKKADIVILDTSSVEAQPLYNSFSHLVYVLNGKAIRDVLINGKLVLQSGKLSQIDEPELIAKARQYHDTVLKVLR